MGVTVKAVDSRAELEVFLNLPARIYRDNPYWVPTPPGVTRWQLTPGKNPFFARGRCQSFLAWEGERPLGRITATVDEGFPDKETGFFGFFEVEENREAAAGLLQAASSWLQGQGRTKILGPFSLSTNQEAGLLVEGFNLIPPVGLSYHSPYYSRLLEETGLERDHDYLAYSWSFHHPPPQNLIRVVARVQGKPHISLKKLPLNREGVGVFRHLFNESMSANRDFSPLSPEEARCTLQGWASFADPDLLLVIEDQGNPIAFAIGLPDINQVLQASGGKLPPTSPFRKATRLRAALMGVVPGARRQGIEALLLLSLWQQGQKKGYQEANLSLVLEENQMMNRIIGKLPEPRISARYRVYKKSFR